MTEPTKEQRAAATAILDNTELANLDEAIGALIAERDAARREAIEECARIADREREQHRNGGARNACKAIADDIRALFEPKAEER